MHFIKGELLAGGVLDSPLLRRLIIPIDTLDKVIALAGWMASIWTSRVDPILSLGR